MWQRIKCWWFGHDWKQQGFSTVRHFDENYYGRIIELGKKDHYLFLCTRCNKIWEHTCKTTYDPVDDDNDMHKKPEKIDTSEERTQQN